jgi:hypothetical protein
LLIALLLQRLLHPRNKTRIHAPEGRWTPLPDKCVANL